MSTIRKRPIYGNCMVYSPEGKLMFRCLHKRAKWYLKRNLAIILEENPLKIKLTFSPKGDGEEIEYLKIERHNRCVVCGNDDLENLTKHHVVPGEYRKHFPTSMKIHKSLDILIVCKECHKKYERHYAEKLKNELSEKYGITRNKECKSSKAKKFSRTLILHKNELPEHIKEEMFTYLKEFVKSKQIVLYADLFSDESLHKILDEAKKREKSHGQLIMENCNNLQEFECIWRMNFIFNMNPKFLPEGYAELYNIA